MRFASLAVVVLVLGIAHRPADAGSGPTATPVASPLETAPAPAPAPAARLSPVTAGALTLGLGAGSLLLMVEGGQHDNAGLFALGGIGAILGPAAGLWYVHHQGGLGIAVRAVAAFAFMKGLALALSDDDGSGSGPSNPHTDWAGPLMLGGAGLWAGSVIYDAVAASHAADRWNREHVMIAPTAVSTGGAPAPGVAVGFSF